MAFWIPAIMAASTILGNLSKSRSEGRQAAANTNLQRDQLATSQWAQQQNAGLTAAQAGSAEGRDLARLQQEQEQFKLSAPGARAGNAVRGDLLANVQDASISHPRATIPTISGGMRPSMLSGETRQLGREMTREALMSQLEGSPLSLPERTDFDARLSAPPGQTPLPQASGLDKFLNIAAPIAGLVGGIGSAGTTGAQTPTKAAELLEAVSPTDPNAIQIPGLPGFYRPRVGG